MSLRFGKYRVFRGKAFDANAAAYFAAAGITGINERNAVNNFIVQMKSAALWNKCERVWLISPTSLSAALYCAKSLNQMTAINAPTHSSTGIVFNGTTQALNTNTALNAYTLFTQDSASFGVYNRASSPGVSFPVYMGALASTANGVYRNVAGGSQDSRCNSTINSTFVTATVTGLHTVSRESASTIRQYINGSNVVTNGGSTSAARVAFAFYIGANNASGVTDLFSTTEVAFAYVGTTFSIAESASLYTIVQAYQTALGRQV
jgi:hypothetical protein